MSAGGMIAFEIVLAILELIAGTAVGEDQMQRQNSRTSRISQVSNFYQAASDIYGTTVQQLDQLLSRWDLKMSQLAESTRGSARLSKASKIYRDYITRYPDAVARINAAKNKINNEAARLTSRSNEANSAIQKGENWSQYTVNKDIAQSNSAIGKTLTGVYGPDGSNPYDESWSNSIDTSLAGKDTRSEAEKSWDPYDWNGDGKLSGWELQRGKVPEGWKRDPSDKWGNKSEEAYQNYKKSQKG